MAEVKKYYGFGNGDFILGALFLTAGLIMRHACEDENSTMCEKIDHDGRILVILGSFLMALQFVVVCIASFIVTILK